VGILLAMDEPSWGLRPARSDDREFLFRLNEARMRAYIERVWGWDEAEQANFFEKRFQLNGWQIIQSDGQDIDVLVVDERAEKIFLASIEILPEWQGRGIGSSVLRSLMDRAIASGKPLWLRVLRVNERARSLFERLGFRPFAESETHTYLHWGARSSREPNALAEGRRRARCRPWDRRPRVARGLVHRGHFQLARRP
jgi:ribosomal protein S18 acetylase RimI-like enzyme